MDRTWARSAAATELLTALNCRQSTLPRQVCFLITATSRQTNHDLQAPTRDDTKGSTPSELPC